MPTFKALILGFELSRIVSWLVVSAFMLVAVPAADASVVEFFFGWNPQLQAQRSAQAHDRTMMRMQQSHAAKMARYGRPPATAYRPGYGVGYSYSAPPRVYYVPSRSTVQFQYYH